MNSNRRIFMLQTAVGAGALATAHLANAQTPAMLKETDPQAVALGYKEDATKADKVKFPKYAAGEHCANCALFQGKAADAAGPCPLFPGKQVAAKGWCSAWAKKA